MKLPHFALVLSLLASCGGDDDGGLTTLGQACSRIAGPACDRAIVCKIGPDSNKQACVAAFMGGCCQDDANCERKAVDQEANTALQQYITRCSAAFPTWDCAQYEMGVVPPECRSPSSSAVSEPMSLPAPEVVAPADLPRARELGRTVGRARRLLSN